MADLYKPAYDRSQVLPLAECAKSEFCTLSTIGEEDPAVKARACKLAAMQILETTGEVSGCPQIVTTELIRQQQEYEDFIDGESLTQPALTSEKANQIHDALLVMDEGYRGRFYA